MTFHNTPLVDILFQKIHEENYFLGSTGMSPFNDFNMAVTQDFIFQNGML